MVWLFSYGTLQLPAVQQASFGRLLNGRADAMVGYRREMIAITDPTVLAQSGAPFHPIVMPSANLSDEVSGVAFEITETELAAADRYEVSAYRRCEVTLKSGLRAWVYIQA